MNYLDYNDIRLPFGFWCKPTRELAGSASDTKGKVQKQQGDTKGKVQKQLKQVQEKTQQQRDMKEKVRKQLKQVQEKMQQQQKRIPVDQTRELGPSDCHFGFWCKGN